MSAIIATLPTGSGVTAVAEHRPRRDPDRHGSGEEDGHAEERPTDHQSAAQPHAEAAPPPADDPAMPAELLFATALLANHQPPRLPSPDELRLRTGQGWTPPDSSLRLKDKLI